MEHLALEIFDREGTGSQYATLPKDTSITIVRTSRIFDKGYVWSHNFTLNIPANLHIFGTSGDLHGSRLHEQVNKRRARLWVEGLPLYLGLLKLGDDVDVDKNGDIGISFESGNKTFEGMIEGGKANQVPLLSDVLIGMALWRKRDSYAYLQMKSYINFSVNNFPYSSEDYIEGDYGSRNIGFASDGEFTSVEQYPRMVFPKGRFKDLTSESEYNINRLNTDYPYDAEHPYCNVALCYQKHGFPVDKKTGQTLYGEQQVELREYETMPANRVNSAPCFYVPYWIECLMKYLNIHIDENQMTDVEDLRRLFFVNTNCDYETIEYLRNTNELDPKYGKYQFYQDKRYLSEDISFKNNVNIAESHLKSSNFTLQNPTFTPDREIDDTERELINKYLETLSTQINKITINIVQAENPGNEQEIADLYKFQNSYCHKAFATSKCFPNEDISKVISSLENAFGIRFVFDEQFQRVRIVLLRNLLRSSTIQNIECDILSGISKQENGVRGFRMTFGLGEDNTEFYYKGFADKLPSKKELWADNSDTHDYSQWELDAEYKNIIGKISAFDKTCYVTPQNGNAYGIKIDKDTKRYEDLHPSLFEFAGYMNAEDGDCAGEEDTIKEINVGFTPAIMNDVNFEAERTDIIDKQQFALFVDEEMRSRRFDYTNQNGDSFNASDAVYDIDKLKKENSILLELGKFEIASDTVCAQTHLLTHISLKNGIDIIGPIDEYHRPIPGTISWRVILDVEGYINSGYKLYLQDNYEPNDDGISPIEKHDWGLTLGIMRGSGSDAYISYQADVEDEGNDTWDLVPGSSATAHPDTCDSYGREWDYSRETVVKTAAQAIAELAVQFPNSNAAFNISDKGYIFYADVESVIDDELKEHHILFATIRRTPNSTVPRSIISMDELRQYILSLQQHSVADMLAMDAANRCVIVEIDSSSERSKTLVDLCWKAYSGQATPDIKIDNGVSSRYGRFSLKLRAEKPNPYYDPSLSPVVTTKEQAGRAMKRLYQTANCNLLNRPKVSKATMREAGWDCPGDGYATVFSVGYGVQQPDGTIHEVLWTPIRTNGLVMPKQQMENYVAIFSNISVSDFKTVDVLNLILDIDTTEQRAEILNGLQAIYYAEEGEEVEPVDISSEDKRYLEISNPNLRGRGLMDQFHKEESYWWRNARTANIKTRMGIEQLQALDDTVQMQVGDIRGFMKKVECTVNINSGLGPVNLQLMYL